LIRVFYVSYPRPFRILTRCPPRSVQIRAAPLLRDGTGREHPLCSGLSSALPLPHPHRPNRDGRVLRAVHVQQALLLRSAHRRRPPPDDLGRVARRRPERRLHHRPVRRRSAVQDRIRECHLQWVHEPRVGHGSRLARLLGRDSGLVRGCAAARRT